MIQDGVYLSSRDTPALWTWAGGLLVIAIGSSLLIGFLTPFACTLGALISAAIAFSLLPVDTDNLLHNELSLLFLMSMATVMMLLGPGAYSLDARLFGRREIIIPQAPRPSKS